MGVVKKINKHYCIASSSAIISRSFIAQEDIFHAILSVRDSNYLYLCINNACVAYFHG